MNWRILVERTDFIKILAEEFFRSEDRYDVLNDNYAIRDISTTEIVRIMCVKESVDELHDLLKREYIRDNWEDFTDDMVNLLFQLLSISAYNNEIPYSIVEDASKLYYILLEKLFDITLKGDIFLEDINKLYLEHMERVKNFLINIKKYHN
jgi:hypothetical protein